MTDRNELDEDLRGDDPSEYQTDDGVGYCLIDVGGKPCGAVVHAKVWRGARDGYGVPMEPDDVMYSCEAGHTDLGDSEWSESEPDEEDCDADA